MTHEIAWTASAWMADIVLPICTAAERNDIDADNTSTVIVPIKAAIEPLYESSQEGGREGRILSATRLTVLDNKGDWLKVRVDGWQQDEQKLWGYGKELHGTTCGACHMAIPANHFLANQWIGVMKDMKRNIRHLSKEQYRFLQKYLQLNAKDVKGDNH